MSEICLNKGFILEFTVGGSDFSVEGIFSCALKNGRLEFSIKYSTHDEPLWLRAEAKIGDKAEVWVLPYRIELWINGKQEDEEWPWGTHRLCEAELEKYFAVSQIPEKAEEPSVTGEFRNAERWKPEPNVLVGDCMPYSDGERYHVLYLKDRHHHTSKWHKGAHQWAHISTVDFDLWQTHPMAVEIDEDREGSICTGSHIKLGTRTYLFYTVRTCDGSPAPLRRSISEDGYHYVKDREFSFKLSDKYTADSARDPKVVLDSEGVYHIFLTTTLRESRRGCLAHLISRDLDSWEEIEPIYVAPDGNEPECSDYFELNGWYYLIFSHLGRGEYRYSRSPFSGWIEPEDKYIPCETVPKMALWNGRIIFAGYHPDFSDKYAGTMTFKEMRQKENGELEAVK